MKHAFTIIELVFTIVILGILASTAIPRLMATRSDAEISKFAMQLAMSVMDMAVYYTAKGEFGDIKDMTHSILDSNGKVKVQSRECVQVAVGYATSGEVDSSKGIVIGTPVVRIAAINSGDRICRNAQDAGRKIIDSSPINVGQQSVKFN